MYRLTSTLCQPLSLSYFGCPCVPSGIKYWRLFDHCFAWVQWTWRRSSILEILFVLQVENYFSYLGLYSCLIEQSNERMNDRSDTTQMMKRCIDVKGSNYVEFPIQAGNIIRSVKHKQPGSLSLRSKSSLNCAPSGFCVQLPKPAPINR
jgi:hypothetical protein